MKLRLNLLFCCTILVMSCYDARGLAIRTPTEMPMTPSAAGEPPKRLDAGQELDAGTTLPMDAGMMPQEADAGIPSIDPCTFELTVHTPRIDPRDTWSIADFNRLVDCVDKDPSNQAQYVEQFWTSHLSYGGSAIWDGANAIILHRGDTEGLSVSGSFDNWPEDQGRAFQRIGDSDLSFLQIPLDRNGRYQYKLLRVQDNEKTWTMDEANRWIVWDGFDQGSIGNFNNEIIGPGHRLEGGLLYRYEFGLRDVYLYLPSAYFEAGDIRKILYVSDGNEYLTRAGIQTVMDETILANRVSPLVGVFLGLESQNERIQEYTYGPGQKGDAYVDSLATDWVPKIEQYFGLDIQASQRGITGASLGGLISFYAAVKHNHVFQKIAAQSGSFWYGEGDMISRIRNGPVMNARFYLDSGSPNDNSESTRLMVDALEARGYEYHHIEESGGQHEWSYWAGRFDEMLENLFR